MRRSNALWFALVIATIAGCPSDDADTGALVTSPRDTTIVIPPDGVATDTGRSDTGPQGDTGPPADIVAGEFLAPCQGNTDCLDGYCVEGLDGLFCTRSCVEECPESMDCRSVITGSADPVFLCLPRLKKLCIPCKTDFQCSGGACLATDGGGRCGYACEVAGDCPVGFDCLTDSTGDHDGTYCQPRSGSCDCTPELDGSIRTCAVSNTVGACFGVETCDPSVGWVDCNAATPAEETCDGRDNDCNALVDDGLAEEAACAHEVAGVGRCEGVEVCVGTQGWVCTADTPEIEICDFKDNDCDGLTDEDFKDDNGTWTRDAHCGSCGNDCTSRFPHGTGRCVGIDGAAPLCVIDECDDDYIALNRFQCVLPPDVSCQPCLDDGDCFGGSCVALDGQLVCMAPCGADAEACQDGYACETTAPDTRRCVPVTGSCVCGDLTHGQQRTCATTNDAGTCFGQEVCDRDDGWSTCDAKEPAPEQCDGVDNNCNGVPDDAVPPPDEPCEATVEGVGTCAGTWFCSDPDGAGGDGVRWWCSAPQPMPEVCDFQDNNCNDKTDEGFVNDDGLYTHPLNCGSCGVRCDQAIPHGDAACVVTDGVARCEVTQCEPGHYQAGRFTCLPVESTLCAPCSVDDHCPTPGDRCLTLDGGGFCGRDCGPDSLHGAACPSGFACRAQAGGGSQCEPLTSSCTCYEASQLNDERSCVRANNLGACFGTETCGGTQGWGACSVEPPTEELCDGQDNDCNRRTDDVPGRGAACVVKNEVGECPGVRDCVNGTTALVCVGDAATEERCNYEDDDCSGAPDEPFTDLFTPCSVGDGLCARVGVRVCTDDGLATECNVTPGPKADEICDGFDNDCDKAVDEDWPTLGDGCFAGRGVCASPGKVVCDGDHSVACDATEDLSQRATELCDLQDNDCDGTTDNGFINSSGDYVSHDACGNCFTNCEVIFDGATAGYGQCNTDHAPTCKLTCCRQGDGNAACDGGDHFDLNAVPGDGCEFLLDPLAVYVSESDDAAKDDGTCGLGPSNLGLGTHPCASIVHGIARAKTLNRPKVLVAGGAYPRSIAVKSGVSLYGGYHPTTWERNPRVNLTAIFGNDASGHRKTVVVTGIDAATVVDGFTIYGQTAGGIGDNSYAVYLRNVGRLFTLSDNVIHGGTGGAGDSGTRGGNGDPGGHGKNGHVAFEPDSALYACAEECVAGGGSNGGGAAGKNAECAGANGGVGGTADCPDFNEDVNQCLSWLGDEEYSSQSRGINWGGLGQGSGGTAGEGGCDSYIDPSDPRDLTCDCFPPNADPTACPLGAFAGAGGNGDDGGPGDAGKKCASTDGTVTNGEWRGPTAFAGDRGGHGAGGGGGGAGGGVESYLNQDYVCGSLGSDFGGSGGGGGAGGCGAKGGLGGESGGGAFGIFVTFDNPPGTDVPALLDNDVHTGFGGPGGAGGEAGTPGTGGNGGKGGPGGTLQDLHWCASPGGKGGEGGDGGPGGGGGGGCGGVSFGVYVAGHAGADLTGWANDISLSGAGGTPGVGGLSSAGGNSGELGDTGTHRARNY